MISFQKQKNILILMMTLLSIMVCGANSSRPQVVTSFGGECAGEKTTFSKSLTLLIQRLRQQTKVPCNNDFCQGVFAYDLNDDERQEYFVRLNCGATGNCTWGVFSDNPAKMQGRFTAWFFYIHKPKDRWAAISTYTREGGNKGVVGQLAYRHGKYHLTSERLDTGTFDNPEPYLKKMGIPKCSL